MCTYCNPATSKEAPSCGKRPPASCWRVGVVLLCFYRNKVILRKGHFSSSIQIFSLF